MTKTVQTLFISVYALTLLSACGNKEIEKEDPNGIVLEETIFETTEDTIAVNSEMDIDTKIVGNDFDSVLDDYEEYVDEYIVFYKKAISGDDAALTEYMSMLEKAEELQKSLETSRSEMTTKQASRMLKIQQKMLNAMSN